MFLPDIERSYPLAYHQKLLVPRIMDWNVTREQDGVSVGNFGTISAYQDGRSRFITGLLPDRFSKDYPLGEVS